MKAISNNPFFRDPDHPNFNRRARHHDYTRLARYLITIMKNPDIPIFSKIHGNPASSNQADIKVDLSSVGEMIKDSISAWMRKYPVFVEEQAIMPDHIHICVNVVASLPNGLSRAVANLMGTVTKTNWLSISERDRPKIMTPVFKKGFNDRIAYNNEQWERQLQYTADNPRRYLFKKIHPDYLVKKWLLTMPGDRQFVLKGNIFLLRQPQLFRVKTSRQFSSEEASAAMAQWKEWLYNGAIPVSPFIHPHEKQLRDTAVEEGFSYIRVCTNGFAERESAVGMEFDLMAAGRLLLIGQYSHNSRKKELRYSYASSLNALSEEIVNLCNQGHGFSIRPLQ